MPKRTDNPTPQTLRSRRFYERQQIGIELPTCVCCGATLYHPESVSNPLRVDLGYCSSCWIETPEGKAEKSERDKLRYKKIAKPRPPKPFTDAEKAKYAKNQARVDRYFQLWQQGETLEQIAEGEGISKQAVSLWINLHPEYRFRNNPN